MLFLVAAATAASCLDVGDVDDLLVEIDFVRSTLSERWTVSWAPGTCEVPDSIPVAITGAKLGEVVKAKDGRERLEVSRLDLLSGAGSGSLEPWRAKAQDTRVVFRAPSSIPLQVFTDESAHQYAERGVYEVWWDEGDLDVPVLVWTSWADWVGAGTVLEKPVLRRVPSLRELGTLGRSLRRAELSTLVDRLDNSLDLMDEEPNGWAPGRDIADVLASGRGTPTERGLILLAMLREAGFDARPAWFTPDDNPVLPRTLPAPHLLLYPAIGVRVGKEILYIDPGTTGARPPEVPARMRGGRVLVAGRHLTVPIDTGAPRGEVRISADLQVARSGQITVVADLVPTGAAEQVLRSLLSRLDAPEWPAAVTPWITPRGDLRDLVVDVKGLDGLEPFRVILRYTEPTKLQGTGTTLRGPVRDIVAPWLAETLPPGIAIEERIRVVPPEGLLALTAIRPEHGESNAILLNRSLATEGTELMLSSDWRVLGARSPGAELQKLPKDTEVLLFPADATARRAAKRLDLADNDKAVIDALLLWRLDEPEKARKVLDRLHPRKLSVIELGGLIAHYASPGDRRPWQALVTLVGTDDERIAVIDDLVTTGDRRLAWQLATFMAKNSADPVARTKALVQVARFQGPEQPDGQADPEGHKAWRDPIKLLEKASSLAGDRQDLVRLELARAFLRQGTPMAAEELLDKAMEAPTPLTKAVRAEFGAMTGVQGVDVLGLVKEAIAEAPFDPDVRESAGRALAFLGRRRQGVADILLAAELAGNDSTRWLTAARFAADFGDLRAAVFAARRASDLEPRGLVQAVQLQLLAKLARNTSALELAVRRSGGTPLYDDIPDDLDSLVSLAANQIPQDPVEAAEGKAHPWKLALLRHHVGDVESDPRLLLERAMLHYERGMTEDAAQDGSLLLDRYQSPDGARFVLGGVTARFRHADPASLVRRYTRSAEVRDALVDLELVTGGRPEPAGEKGRREVVSLMRSNPGRVAMQASTWPVGKRAFTAPGPVGFEANRYLSAIDGLLAWSDPERQMTVVITATSIGELPPPFANLYKNGPTVLSTRRGATVIRLDGGAIPVFAGVTISEGRDVWGFGLSPSTARDAVLYGIRALEAPPL